MRGVELASCTLHPTARDAESGVPGGDGCLLGPVHLEGPLRGQPVPRPRSQPWPSSSEPGGSRVPPARRPCASLPLLRPRAAGHAAPSGHSARPVSTRPQVRGHGHRLPQLRHHGALRQPVLGAHFALDSFQLGRRRAPFGRGRVSALPLSAARLGSRGACSLFGPHPSPPSRSPSRAQALEWRRGQRPTNRYTVYVSH